MCSHLPPCPPASAPDRDAARVVSAHQEQGWSLLCNGVIAFDDLGDLLPEGRAVPPPSDRWQSGLDDLVDASRTRTTRRRRVPSSAR